MLFTLPEIIHIPAPSPPVLESPAIFVYASMQHPQPIIIHLPSRHKSAALPWDFAVSRSAALLLFARISSGIIRWESLAEI